MSKRDEKVREKMKKREEARIKSRKESKRAVLLENKFRKKGSTIVNDKEEAMRKQLEYNYEVLKALEEEHLQEQEARRLLNESLEAQGAFTLEDKMKLMGQQVVKKSDETVGKMKGSAEVKFNPNPE